MPRVSPSALTAAQLEKLLNASNTGMMQRITALLVQNNQKLEVQQKENHDAMREEMSKLLNSSAGSSSTPAAATDDDSSDDEAPKGKKGKGTFILLACGKGRCPPVVASLALLTPCVPPCAARGRRRTSKTRPCKRT
eukprot:Transcript_17733.p1 GENE.Transcript_17733~~Transcript_17733.p1  ORF type:complete len:137 (-),score=34.70 Transcript_17733:100-510(-)